MVRLEATAPNPGNFTLALFSVDPTVDPPEDGRSRLPTDAYTVTVFPDDAPIFESFTIDLDEPLAEGNYLAVERNTDILNDLLVKDGDPFPSEQFEFMMDKVCLIEQELEAHYCDCRNTCTAVFITQQPSNYDAAGATSGDATFQVTGDGTEPITYQWYRDGVLMSGETAATLVVPIVGNEDADFYVILNNACGTRQSNTVTITEEGVTLIPELLYDAGTSWAGYGWKLQVATNNDGSIIMANVDGGGGLYRSIDQGQNWTYIDMYGNKSSHPYGGLRYDPVNDQFIVQAQREQLDSTYYLRSSDGIAWGEYFPADTFNYAYNTGFAITDTEVFFGEIREGGSRPAPGTKRQLTSWRFDILSGVVTRLREYSGTASVNQSTWGGAVLGRTGGVINNAFVFPHGLQGSTPNYLRITDLLSQFETPWPIQFDGRLFDGASNGQGDILGVSSFGTNQVLVHPVNINVFYEGDVTPIDVDFKTPVDYARICAANVPGAGWVYMIAAVEVNDRNRMRVCWCNADGTYANWSNPTTIPLPTTFEPVGNAFYTELRHGHGDWWYYVYFKKTPGQGATVVSYQLIRFEMPLP